MARAAGLRSVIDSTGPRIGTLNEGSLHAALKARYRLPGDEIEVPVGDFVVDIRRPGLLVEIQTTSFRAMGSKLDRLLDAHRMLLVHPIAAETYLLRPGKRERRSPLRRSVHALFDELVSIPTLLDHPNLTLEVALVSVTRVEEADRRARRGHGGWRTVDTRLREVRAVHRFETADDLAGLLPPTLPPRFTTGDLATRAGISRDRAQRMAFCFRALELLKEVGRSRAGVLYARTSDP